MSVLLASTLAVLRAHRKAEPLFPNMIVAELFESAHTRARYRLLPRTVGGYVLFDSEAEPNRGVIAELSDLRSAHAALEAM